MNDCQQTINSFINREIGDWEGLPADCEEQALKELYPLSEVAGVYTVGKAQRQYTFRTMTMKGFESPVFFYFAGTKLSMITTEYWSFNAEECRHIYIKSGMPFSRLDFYWGNEILADAEWVYPEKGITLCVIPETGLLVKVIVYPACSLEVYKSTYYHTTSGREFPAKKI
ncbi:hypothetical protein CLV51_105175 [Chitinophaga niastensis]|uniref:Uncharacterized protein n=1 Tax=Chitinophaga niastensis TaxID=536980 RepID=A0A2P8HF12_CHINA|nr:hypothetical protein [Chitinophaga niastensis]PSL44803.1 hypothetical protein CLV51_105175 [Chitinophaga niastensis]